MDKPTRTDRELWMAEAMGAVLGDDRWTCLSAGIATNGSNFFAIYKMKQTGTRRTVTLPCFRSRSFAERRAEIRRRLGIASAIEVEAPRPLDGVRPRHRA
jgi:hypothetical protein